MGFIGKQINFVKGRNLKCLSSHKLMQQEPDKCRDPVPTVTSWIFIVLRRTRKDLCWKLSATQNVDDFVCRLRY